MRKMRGCFKGNPKRISLQDEKNAKDDEKAGKAVWWGFVQQMHEIGNHKQNKAIK